MKKSFIFAFIFVLIIGSFSSFSITKGEEAPTVLGEFAKLEDGNWINLTKKQKLEDFDFLYQTLQENYPYFHVLKRKIGVDLEKEYKKIRKQIKKSKTDAQFYVLLNQFTAAAKDIGHLGSIFPFGYLDTVKTYKNIENVLTNEKEKEWSRKLAQAYGNSKSKKSYKKLVKLLEPVYNRVMDYYNSIAEQEGNEASEVWTNIETKILEQDKIAYINVKSFDMNLYEEDKKTLFDFYSQIKDYPNVIFDFTENGGGGMGYFNDLIVSPNIDKPLSTKTYQFIKDGEYNRKFLDINDFKPVSSIEKLPNMNEEDLADLDFVAEEEYRVEPLANNKMLNGKIWILVSGTVFSSSEYAVMFSKDTKFAALVGTQTGGDGIGVDPLPIVLPNSGLIVRYSSIYGTTKDGTGSQEYGTTPDIISPKGESALDTCLKAIKEEETK